MNLILNAFLKIYRFRLELRGIINGEIPSPRGCGEEVREDDRRNFVKANSQIAQQADLQIQQLVWFVCIRQPRCGMQLEPKPQEASYCGGDMPNTTQTGSDVLAIQILQMALGQALWNVCYLLRIGTTTTSSTGLGEEFLCWTETEHPLARTRGHFAVTQGALILCDDAATSTMQRSKCVCLFCRHGCRFTSAASEQWRNRVSNGFASVKKFQPIWRQKSENQTAEVHLKVVTRSKSW